jgi:hypothetical protein
MDQVNRKRTPATGYSQGVGVLRVYPVAGGLELITGCIQQGKQIQADIY